MLIRGIRALAGLFMAMGAVGIIISGVLLWSAVNSSTLPPPIDETNDVLALDPQAAYNPNEWQNCVSCHWEIVGGRPPSGLLESSDLDKVPPEDAPGNPALTPSPARPRAPIPTPTPRSTPTPQPQHKGALPERLTIPGVGIDGKVVLARAAALEGGGADWEVPLENIAWYVGTALPDSRGNTVMAGHVITRQGDGVFRNLHLVRKGDPIYIETKEGQVTYTVTAVRQVLPSDISVLAETGEPMLILITCAGDFDEATRTYNLRLVVTARLETKQ